MMERVIYPRYPGSVQQPPQSGQQSLPLLEFRPLYAPPFRNWQKLRENTLKDSLL